MISHSEIMPLNFFNYGGVYSGEHCGMRYMIKRVGEKPDFKLAAFAWQAPYGYDAIPKDDILSDEFDNTEDGRTKAIDWLISMYETHKERWDIAPSILDAPIDLSKIYS